MGKKIPGTAWRPVPGDNEIYRLIVKLISSFCQPYMAVMPSNLPLLVSVIDRLLREVRA